MATSHKLDATISPVGKGLFYRYRATAYDGTSLVVAVERESFRAAKRALKRGMRLYTKSNIRTLMVDFDRSV